MLYLGHALGGLRVRATSGVSIDLLAGDGLEELDKLWAQSILDSVVVLRRGLGWRSDRRGELDLANGRDKGNDLDAVDSLQVLLGDGAGGNTADGLASAAASTTAARLDAVLLEVSPVGMAGTGVKVGLGETP